jgi:hypothetical protein
MIVRHSVGALLALAAALLALTPVSSQTAMTPDIPANFAPSDDLKDFTVREVKSRCVTA